MSLGAGQVEQEPTGALHPVAQVLRTRREQGSRPGARSDGLRVGLAIEGGGIRGIVSGAMLLALERMGLRTAFDDVYGSSAGAINAAYFLTGQTVEAMPLYYDEMTASEFVDLRRLVRREPVVSVDWVLDAVMERVVPLNWQRVLSSAVPLHVIASSVGDLSTVVFSDLGDKADLKAALRASSRIPFVAGPPVRFRDYELLDAAVLQAHPYESAVADGCTHVLALSTRGRGRLRPPATIWERLVAVRLNRLRRGLGDRHLARIANYRRAQERLLALTTVPREQPFVLDVAPDPAIADVRQLDRDVRRILAGARAGYEAAYRAVAGEAVRAFVSLDHADVDPGGAERHI
jgi:predicted patatin/cPLA2 family phospholipase